jgi:hypothetical protein
MPSWKDGEESTDEDISMGDGFMDMEYFVSILLSD